MIHDNQQREVTLTKMFNFLTTEEKIISVDNLMKSAIHSFFQQPPIDKRKCCAVLNEWKPRIESIKIT